MPVGRHREQELTFDVPADWPLPSLDAVVFDGRRVDEATHQLEATYYDTAAGTLRRLGMTLRRRSGGHDAGWHLKIPTGEARAEVHSQAATDAVPAALRRRVAGVVGSMRLDPVATLSTTRRAVSLLDGDGGLVLELADDHVVGRRDGAPPVEWREIEIELGDSGDEKDLTAVGDVLRDAGARPAAVDRKINRVLGDPAPDAAADIPEVNRLVEVYVREQCRAILVGDVLLRDEPAPAPVHRTRVAVRRLRSTLRLFARAFDAASGDDLDADLKWFAGLLSPIRDADILGRRLERELKALSDEDVMGPVRGELKRELARRRREAVVALREGWTDERYLRMMRVLAEWFDRVPVSQKRIRPRKTLRKAQRTVDRRLARAAEDRAALHRARKAAKRLRYAGDLLAPQVSGAAAKADGAKRLQTSLGDHQDLVVAEAFLREMGRIGSSGYTYGVLAARVTEEARQLRKRL